MNKKGFSTIAIIGVVVLVAVFIVGFSFLTGEKSDIPTISKEVPPMDLGRVEIKLNSITDDFYGNVTIDKIVSYERNENSAFESLKNGDVVSSARFLYSVRPAQLLDPEADYYGVYPVDATSTAVINGEVRVVKLPSRIIDLPGNGEECNDEFCFLRNSSPALLLPGVNVEDRILADVIYDGSWLGIGEYQVIR